jgi:hypothetical protein
MVAGCLKIRAAFFCGIDWCKEKLELERYGFIALKGGYIPVTLPRTLTPYRESVDGSRDHVTYQNLVTRNVQCAVGI